MALIKCKECEKEFSAKAVQNDIKERHYNSHIQEFDKILENNVK